MFTSYSVIIEKFAERHFISKFKKKHKNAWDITWNANIELFRRIDAVVGTSDIAKVIHSSEDVRIVKTEFRIAGPGKSRHASGNRCIVAVHKNTATVHVLFVYSKTDLATSNETVQWEQVIKDNYPQYKGLF